MREESRGAHTRVDHEGESEEWGKYNVFVWRGDDGEMKIERRERPEPAKGLKEIGYAKIEDLESGKVGADVE